MLTITRKSIRKIVEPKPLTRDAILREFQKGIKPFGIRHEDRLYTLIQSSLNKPNGLKTVSLTYTEIVDGVPIEKAIPGFAAN